MKKIILTAGALILLLGTLICLLGFEGLNGGAVPAFLGAGAPASTPAAAPTTPAPGASATPAAPAPSETPAPTQAAPLEEDPSLAAKMAWDALFTYPTHEAPVRVLALFAKVGGTGDILYRQMLAEGKLMAKGAYYADGGEDPTGWTRSALKSIPVGLLDSIYAENPALALAAYKALTEAGRNDSVEVICGGITEEVLAAMRADHFSMGAAAGVYENEMRVVYAEEFRAN